MAFSLSIAVCIPTRNQSGMITDALRSAFGQTMAPVDVVVTDDAGTDDTEAVVAGFRASLPPDQQARLRYDRSPRQLGIGGNFDRGVRLAQGDLVVKLDSDDILEPEFIEILSARLAAHPRAGWAHCNVWNIRPEGENIALAHTRKPGGFYAADDALPAYLKHNDTCHCVLIRKAAYLAVGGYRTDMKTAEDWLLWLEMMLSGWGYYYEAKPLARMRKYEARPELMSKRRKDFVASIRFMKTRVEQLMREKLAGDTRLDSPTAMRIFTATAARLCVTSGCDEGDAEVRKLLFETACEFEPSWRNRSWRIIGARLPVGSTRRIIQMAGLPRHWARVCMQKIRPAKSAPAPRS